MAQEGAKMPTHYNCGGKLVESDVPMEHVCRLCGNRVRNSVLEREERFRRVAQSENRLSELAEYALEGVDD